MLHTLSYVSSTAREFGLDDLLALLDEARPRNEAAGITGMLLYSGGNIIQVLEGAEPDVHAVFASIEADRRHHDVSVLLDEPLELRAFSGWSMGCRDVDDADPAHLDGFDDFLATPAGRGLGRVAAPTYQLLEIFRDSMR